MDNLMSMLALTLNQGNCTHAEGEGTVLKDKAFILVIVNRKREDVYTVCQHAHAYIFLLHCYFWLVVKYHFYTVFFY